MNRETQAHFAQIPSMDISRSKFDRSFIHKSSCNVGELVPIYVDCDIVPGDTVTMRVADLIRMTTPITPVMDELKVDFYFFFVPNRLVWANFKKFMGENTNAPWIQTVEYTIPQIKILNNGEGVTEDGKLQGTVLKGSVLDHMGIPTNYKWKKYRSTVTDPDTEESTKREIRISSLPPKAYALIWNEFFRSEALQNPINIFTGDSVYPIYNTNVSTYQSDPEAAQVSYAARGGLPCLKVCKTFDYFTACLPAAQAGPDVTLPMNGTAPIKTATFEADFEGNPKEYGLNSEDLYAHFGYGDSPADIATLLGEFNETISQDYDGFDVKNYATGKLYADLTQATGATINQLRTAFAIQKWQEREARGGLETGLLVKKIAEKNWKAKLEKAS